MPAGGNRAQRPQFGSAIGLDALVLLRHRQMFVFFVFAMALGAALQITNAFGSAFLDDFRTTHPGTFGVEHPNLLLSISQVSETLFVLTIPFFLRRFGIKQVMLISMFAWVFRFGLFAVGDPGARLWMLVLSMIIYGMAFDFFNISGSLFVERESPSTIRASAQGLFMMVTNGLGAFLGGTVSGRVVDYFTQSGVKDWPSIWLTFAGYALLLGLVFPFLFRYRHHPQPGDRQALIKGSHPFVPRQPGWRARAQRVPRSSQRCARPLSGGRYRGFSAMICSTSGVTRTEEGSAAAASNSSSTASAQDFSIAPSAVCCSRWMRMKEAGHCHISSEGLSA